MLVRHERTDTPGQALVLIVQRHAGAEEPVHLSPEHVELSQDVPLEDVQYLAGHANPRTTQIYNRRRRRVTRNIVERMSG